MPSPCTFPRIIELDGKGSSDPDNNITHYLWTKISGPSTGTLRTLINGRANLENIVVGQYVIELIVIDTKSLSSKDTIVINVEWQPKEYNLDLNINGIYNFIDNYQDCFYYYYYYPCSYYDYTTIEGKGNFSSSEQFSAYVFENADTVNSSDIHYTHLTLQLGNNNNIVTYGTCSINFKKLIQQGGGSFSGSMAINGGSAQSCNPNIFNGLPALLLSGSLDTTTHTINLNIKGRVYY